MCHRPVPSPAPHAGRRGSVCEERGQTAASQPSLGDWPWRSLAPSAPGHMPPACAVTHPPRRQEGFCLRGQGAGVRGADSSLTAVPGGAMPCACCQPVPLRGLGPGGAGWHFMDQPVPGHRPPRGPSPPLPGKEVGGIPRKQLGGGTGVRREWSPGTRLSTVIRRRCRFGRGRRPPQRLWRQVPPPERPPASRRSAAAGAPGIAGRVRRARSLGSCRALQSG